MLRASVEHCGGTVDLRAVADSRVDSGIPHGAALLDFADAVLAAGSDSLGRARDTLQRTLGDGALVQCAAIAANFSMNDRVANATGIVLEPMFVRGSADFRAALGINQYPSARNTLKD